jgi:long-chain fatty acid transport protein
MNRQRTLGTITGIACLALPQLIWANGLRLLSQDGFATARGEAFAATADNPSAIYYNPAGITQIEGTSLRGGIYGIYLDPTFTPPATANNAGNTYEIDNKLAAVPQSFLVHSFDDSPVSLGLGIYAPFGGDVTWPQDTGFRAVTLESSLQYISINPVVAVKLPAGLSLGAGVMANYGNIKLGQGIRRNQLPPPFTDYFRFEGDGWSVGYNAGLLWQPHPKLSIGAMLRSSSTVTFDGETDVLFYPVVAANYQSAAEMEMEFPLMAVAGISYRPTPSWNIEFNADYTDWSSFGTVTIYQANPNPNVQANPSLILDWQPSWIYKLGATRYLEDGWHVSAGYVFNENSVPNQYYTPAAADLDRHFISVGVGRVGKSIDFDVAYQFGYGPDHEVVGSTPSTVGQIAGQSADGTYDFISHAVLVSVGYHF